MIKIEKDGFMNLHIYKQFTVFLFFLVGILFSIAANPKLNSIAFGEGYGNNVFIAVGDNGTLLMSLDGYQWESIEPNWAAYGMFTGEPELNSVIYDNKSYFYVAGTDGIMLISEGIYELPLSDLESMWREFLFSIDPRLTYLAIASNKDEVVLAGTFKSAMPVVQIYSDTFTYNQLRPLLFKNYGYSIINIEYGNGMYLALVNYITENNTISSAIFMLENEAIEGISWTEVFNFDEIKLSSLCYGNGMFVAVGDVDNMDYPSIVVSEDGVEWEPRNYFNKSILNNVSFCKDRFIAVGNDGLIISSSDADDWVQLNSPTISNLHDAVYGDGKFIIIGDQMTILIGDGNKWEIIPLENIQFEGSINLEN